ncbi:MAG: hypothetical protein CH6_0571 [Candidatus Kapaibacterium sp.]|nr:MAG: hypothetical protein CH6_0571 [Candidatus Kapabacteria bacterium]
MTKQVRGRKTETKRKTKVSWTFTLDKENLKWFLIGLGVVALGYILMATGITEEPALPQGKWNNPLVIYVAPIVLVVGYLVIIPYAILKTFKKKQDS